MEEGAPRGIKHPAVAKVPLPPSIGEGGGENVTERNIASEGGYWTYEKWRNDFFTTLSVEEEVSGGSVPIAQRPTLR